jgi:hypothetical protein
MALSAGADLLEAIDWHATECLNASSQHNLDSALKQVTLKPAPQRQSAVTMQCMLVFLLLIGLSCVIVDGVHQRRCCWRRLPRPQMHTHESHLSLYFEACLVRHS